MDGVSAARLEFGSAAGTGSAAARSLAASAGLGRKLDARDPRVVRDAASKLMSELFFGPLLAEMRRSPLAGTIGHGGRGEEVFGARLDQELGDLVAAAERSGLRRAIEAELGRSVP